MDTWILIGLATILLVRGDLLECGAGEMESILNRGEGEESCRPRSTVLRLPDPEDAYSHTTPSHVEVMRCSGSCLHSYHRCIPAKTRTRREKVILAVRSAVAGPVATVCAEIEVEDHVECTCGCDVTAGDCNARQVFLPAECRCGCPNIQERDRCIAQNWYWSPELCQCMCPNRPYPTCPTGYIFDHESACDCRPVSFTAFTLLELVIVVIVTGTLAALLSLAHCYRNGIGFFRHRWDVVGRRRRQHRYRSASFRQKVELLSTRFDRSLQGHVAVAAADRAAAAAGSPAEVSALTGPMVTDTPVTAAAEGEGELMIDQISVECGKNSPPDVSAGSV